MGFDNVVIRCWQDIFLNELVPRTLRSIPGIACRSVRLSIQLVSKLPHLSFDKELEYTLLMTNGVLLAPGRGTSNASFSSLSWGVAVVSFEIVGVDNIFLCD